MRNNRVIVTGSKNRSVGQIGRFLTNYQIFTKKAKKRAVEAVREIGNTVVLNTLPITPKDTGALRESARVTVEKTSRGPRVFVSFGGRDVKVTPTKNAPKGFVDYAVIVHESVDKNFKVGQAKFLDEGFRRSRDEIDRIISDFLNPRKVNNSRNE